jgi:WD40 repeat protein
MRGRAHARIIVPHCEKIGDVKVKIEASTGFPAASQQLQFWAETLPNDATIDELDFLDRAEATIHMVCSSRDPKLKMTLSASGDGSGLKLHDMMNGELLRTFGSTERGANRSSEAPLVPLAMDVHWESMRALLGCFDGRLQLWDLRTEEAGGRGLLCQFEGHQEDVNALAVDWESMRAVSGSGDSSLKLWDLATGSRQSIFQAPSEVFHVGVEWSKNCLYGALRTGVVRAWHLDSGEHIADLNIGKELAEASGTTIASTAVDPAGCRALSGFEDGHLAYWHFSLSKGTPVTGSVVPSPRKMLAHYCAVRTMAVKWSDADSRALCGSDDGSLSLWRLDTQECTARFGRHVGFVWSVSADWDQQRALSGAFDGCVKLWDLRTGDCLRTLQAHSRPVRSVAGGCHAEVGSPLA